ncbi:MAG: hypothetical protein WKG32_15690 [Gemmatimonadaceae bacterium]
MRIAFVALATSLVAGTAAFDTAGDTLTLPAGGPVLARPASARVTETASSKTMDCGYCTPIFNYWVCETATLVSCVPHNILPEGDPVAHCHEGPSGLTAKFGDRRRE